MDGIINPTTVRNVPEPTALEIEFAQHAEPYSFNGITSAPARIEIMPPRRFTFRPDDGLLALVVEVVERGEVVDLVAIRNSRPYTRHGEARMLGRDGFERALFEGRVPELVGDPVAWLGRPHETACILDIDRDAQAELAGVRADIQCADDALARRIHQALTKPRPLPRLLVPANG